MPEYLLSLVAIVLTAVLLGSMVFFAGVMAPLTHRKLPPEVAGAFLREIFPVYYVFLLVVTVLAALAAFRPNPIAAGALALVAIGFAYSRLFLLPRINRLREDPAAAEEGAFRRLHHQSVVINLTQMMLALVILLALAIMGPLAQLFTH
jgi:Domain of unknown function (DUF4149)